MKTDLRCWVIKKGKLYLVGVPGYGEMEPRYSPAVYDAARVKDANDARKIADRIGGNIHRFNPLTGEVV